MTDIAATTERASAPPPPLKEWRLSYRALGAILVVVAAWVWPFVIAPEYRTLAYPIATDISIFAVFLFVLWRWNRTLPAFEIGLFFGAVSLLYAIVPGLNYITGGGWSALSDGRMLLYNPDAKEMARFTWPYTAILVGFCGAYALIRGRKPLEHVPVARERPQITLMIVVAFLLATGYIFVFSLITGAPVDPSYLNGGLQTWSVYYTMPLIVQQITHNVYGIAFATKVCILVLLMQRWKQRRIYRWAVLLWLTADLTTSFLRMGSRTYTALLILMFVLLYHRMVKPLTMKMALFGSALFLTTFIIYGVMRTWGGALQNATAFDSRLWTANNDFQTMFASAYDVKVHLDQHLIAPVPWQLYFSDFFLIIPSQLLPFEKLEPSAWYYAQLNTHNMSMFGYRAQGVIGFGWIELFLRSVVLGIIFALLFRWYQRHASGLWATIGYGYALLWSHYIYRSTMLWPLYFMVYEFFTVMIFVRVGARLLTRMRRSHPAAVRHGVAAPVVGGHGSS